MRTARIILGVFALLWGSLQAPFDHIHAEELAHQATSTPLHMHVHEMLEGPGPLISPRTADDDEVDVLWSATMSSHVVLPMDAELGERVTVLRPSLIAVGILVPRHRGHDPPQFSPKIPRAPPA